MFARMLHDARYSASQAAELLGASRSLIRMMATPGSPKRVWLGDVLVLGDESPRIRETLLRALAERWDERPGPGLQPLAHIARIAQELGQLAERTQAALADGRVDVREADELDRELVHIEEAARAARKDLRRGR